MAMTDNNGNVASVVMDAQNEHSIKIFLKA